MPLGYPAIVIALAVGAADAPADVPLPSTPVSSWARSDEATSGHIDHSTWQVLLNQYLDVHHPSGIVRFEYDAVTPPHRALLARYISTLSALDPRAYPKGEQKAYWINLYNAQTVLLVVDNPDVDSISDIGSTWFGTGPWKAKHLTVDGEPLSLDEIAQTILQPVFQDRRVHYALNCASLGCPNLCSLAFTGANVDALLANAEHTYVNHPRAVRLDGDDLVLSSLYEWHRDDFGADERGVLGYLAEHHDTLADELRAHRGPIRYQYDWSLNRP